MTPVPSATQWGSPGASKRAFLIHGNTCSSHTWETVAQSLAKAGWVMFLSCSAVWSHRFFARPGFLVTAPNMLGHGNRPTDDFHLHTFAQDLHSTYFANGITYDVIIGHSLGGTVTLALLPLLSAPQDKNNAETKTAVILVDPGIEFSDQVLDEFDIRFGGEIRHVRSVEAHMVDHPTWTRQDAVSRVVGLHMVQSGLPKRIFEVRRDHPLPTRSGRVIRHGLRLSCLFSFFSHLFAEIPPHVEMTVLVADPELSKVCPPELVPAHPQIRAVITVKGSGHWIQHENSDVIVKTAVDELGLLSRGVDLPFLCVILFVVDGRAHCSAYSTMLSAVAARKAAKAATETPVAPSSKPTSLPPSQSPSPKPATASKSVNKATSKRKPRANAGPSKNKKAKVAHAPAKPDRNARYFDPGNLSNVRHEVTADQSTSKIEVSTESDSSSGEEMEIEMEIPPPVGLSSISVTRTKRTWSPSRPMLDSSDDEEPGPSGSVYLASSLIQSTSRKPEPLPLSTFHPVPDHNIYLVPESEYATSGMARILVLQPNETLALVGTYSFCVLQGSLSLLGVTLSPSNTKHVVFAPRSSPIPILSWATLDRQGSCTFPIPIAIRQQAKTTAILIEYADTGVEGLGRICKVFENVFKPFRESDAVPGVDLPRIHIINRGTKNIHPFLLPTSWEAALASVDEHPDSEMSTAPVCLVRGPKKSGKSTLARTLVNRLLNIVESRSSNVTLGQSEFTPGGLVALNIVENYTFGPSFSHPSLPYRAHYVGSTSPRASPSHYLHSIQCLLEAYQLDLQFPVSVDDPLPGDERIYDTIPLVVNTMGWTKGLGADLNARIEEFVEFSHIFEIDGAEERGWPAPIQSQHVPQVPSVFPFMQTSARRCVNVEAIQTEMTNTYYTATDYRHLNILSYFHAVFPEPPTSSSLGPVPKQLTATSWDTSLPLCARYPYEVDYTQAFDHVYLTGAGYEDVVPSELPRVLNGAIVGLVSGGPANTSSRPIESTSQAAPSLSYTPAEPPPDPAVSMCHGLALIRGIPLSLNPRSPHMHILTPLPTRLLAQTRVLVKGEMELPIWGMLDFREDEGKVAGIEKGYVPYLQWGRGEGVGAEKRRVRRNLMRKGQM
ncbi:hypothetical protein J3R83DRAFT_302 [Lanmaoa asiatica]|nr:hypothetical protein J3R83DRAFT_302 [Lanmaoa asiatica]